MRLVVAALVLLPLTAGPAGLAGASSVPVEEDYLLQCAACHGGDGAGTPGVTPSLRTIGPLLARDGGREYLARVPGVAQSTLSDARLARLLNWVLEHYADVRPDPPYDAHEIAAWRSRPLRDTRSARDALFEASP